VPLSDRRPVRARGGRLSHTCRSHEYSPLPAKTSLRPEKTCGVREGLYALDEIFALADRDSELTITEHTTDTAGFTDLLFGAYDVVGLGFCPRIRDLADQRL
jgi:hypothetical protein